MLQPLVLGEEFYGKLDDMVPRNVSHHLKLSAGDLKTLGQNLADLSLALSLPNSLHEFFQKGLKRTGAVCIHPELREIMLHCNQDFLKQRH